MTHVRAKLRGPTGKEATIRFLVDSGATYSLVPDGTWQSLELSPLRTVTFTLADGTAELRAVGECWMEIDEGQGTSPVVLGQAGDQPLLGVVSPEVMGLILNPLTRKLAPMRAMMPRAVAA